jgi:adenylate cyclase
MEALSYARRHKAGLENEARILADLANTYCLKGDFSSALHTATEAIDLAIARSSRLPECLARIVRAEVLWASVEDRRGAEEELGRAQVLMEETGGAIYEPLIQDVRTRLDHHASVSLTTVSMADRSRKRRRSIGANYS